MRTESDDHPSAATVTAPPAPRWPRTRLRPACFVIGAQKAGSTSMFRYLVEHPSIRGKEKEPHFFTRHYRKGVSWYASRFPLTRPWRAGEVSVDATPSNLIHRPAPQRMIEMFPDGTFVAILRDPITRAFSHYHHALYRSRTGKTFEQLLDDEPADAGDQLSDMVERGVIPTEPNVPFFPTLLARGRYAEQLEHWLNHVPAERLVVIHAESMYANPQAALDAVLDTMNMPPHTLADASPHNVRDRYDPMSPDTRRRLEHYFVPHNARLGQLLREHGLDQYAQWRTDGAWPAATA